MSYNKIILIGNIGSHPETFNGQSGVIARFPLATSNRWADKSTGEMKEKTQWHNVVTFGKLGEIVEKWGRKGQTVLVEGRVEYSKYEDKEGNTRYSTEIIAETFRILSKKEENQGPEALPPAQSQGDNKEGDDLPF